MASTPIQGSRNRWRIALSAAILGLCLIASGSSSARATEPQEGTATLLLNAKKAFDAHATEATPATQQFAQDNYWGTRAYPPFFDRALGWAPRTHFYKDLYAIYAGSEQELIDEHPDWVLRDASGEPLFIQYGCSGGVCPQYAADIGNPGWRAHWIADAQAQIDKGYIGIHIDDVNLEMRISNGAEQPVRPIDPRTRAPMTDDDWRRYMAEFVEQVRAAIPGAWISHNPHWWLDHDDPYVRREVDAADAIQLERSFSDPGLTGGGGKFGFETFLSHIDWLHARGKAVLFSSYAMDSAAGREFELAAYFLVQRPGDAIVVDEEDHAYPDDWWAGWEADLGAARTGSREWQGLLRRDFRGGIVLVNQPEAQTRVVRLKRRYRRLDGSLTRRVVLGEREGAVLLERAGRGRRSGSRAGGAGRGRGR